jgi:hypothetical protein
MTTDSIPNDFQVLCRTDNIPDFIDRSKLICSVAQMSSTYIIILNPKIKILSSKFWDDIRWLLSQNLYLDVLKHALNTNHVAVKDNKDYWQINRHT